MTRSEIETALDAGNLWAVMANGAHWRLRRNGATRLWKRDAGRFYIPVKAGLRACGGLDQLSSVTAPGGGGDFIVSPDKP